MRIESADVSFQGQHESVRLSQTNTRVEVRIAAPPAPTEDRLSLSTPTPVKSRTGDPKLDMMEQLIEQTFGIEVDLPEEGDFHIRPAPGMDELRAALQPPTVTIEREHVEAEREAIGFSAQAVIRTDDGREIRVDAAFEASRESIRIERDSLRMGAEVKDPLVLNLTGAPAQLEGSRFQLDLDSDGTVDSLAGLSPQSAFLTLDRNGNRQVDDGRELFGPRSGNGFAELAELDSDGNRFIDEDDPDFARLALWNPGTNLYRSLSEAGVGAIHLDSLATPFSLRSPSGEVLGEYLSTGFYLNEDGTAGTVQQLNLAVDA